ncbi:hypothetical protein HDU98_006999 [Podochytrium sp. JEL0797]|nr:hypothetical protein HDU98_006999 [Podochytrium sp. JEL0797]
MKPNLLLLFASAAVHLSLPQTDAAPLAAVRQARFRRTFTECVVMGTPYSEIRGSCVPRGTSVLQCDSIVAGGIFLTVEGDGNVVAYKGSPTSSTGNQALWYTGTNQTNLVSPSFHLDYQLDGNMVLYNGDKPIMAATKTALSGRGSTSDRLCLLETGDLALFEGVVNVGTIIDVKAISVGK